FQKYYEQDELRGYLAEELNTEPVAAGLGVFILFKDPAQNQAYRAARVRSPVARPRPAVRVTKFEANREVLEPLMDFRSARGRFPDGDECESFAGAASAFGGLRRAFKIVQQATGREK